MTQIELGVNMVQRLKGKMAWYERRPNVGMQWQCLHKWQAYADVNSPQSTTTGRMGQE